MKTVQIPCDLLLDLAIYHLRGEDDYEEGICQGLEQKLDAILNRQLYSSYKTAPTEEERGQARQEYLDRRGVPQNYCWTVPPWKLRQEHATLLWLADKAMHWLLSPRVSRPHRKIRRV